MIQIRNLKKAYEGKIVFDDLSFDIRSNVRTVFGGESGIGKTTLLRCIAGLEQPDGGCVTGTQGQKASFVFQDNRLLPWATAEENILCVAPDKDRAADLLDRAGLADAAKKRASALSGGMQRRLAIVRCLAYGGDVFYLDEPLRELDEANERRMLELIREETVGKTVLLITHNKSQADALADDLLFFEGSPMRLADGTESDRRYRQ